MFQELCSGYKDSPETHCKTFDSGGFQDLILVDDIPFHSLCEHHLIPFFGRVSFGYLPDGRMLGLSKFSRVVETLSRRLQTQEHLTHQLAETILRTARPTGLIVQVEAQHLCVAMRGVRKHGVVTITSETHGRFTHDRLLLERYNNQLTARR